MLVNPEIQAWFDKLQGQSQARGSAPRGQVPNYGSDVLAGIVKPGIGMFGFNAPAIEGRFQLRPPAPNPPQERPSGIAPASVSSSGAGARNLGGGAIAAGIGKLGQGIGSALGDIAAKQKAKQAAIANVNALPGSSPVFGVPSKPAASGASGTNGLPSSPPVFGSVGAASDTPIFAQPGTGTGPIGTSIGPSGSLPTFAQGGAAAHPGDIEANIRSAAAQRGIDPDTAVAVARSEGLNAYIGDKGSSFGPFQLHYGGMAGGGNAVPGLGDEFTRRTGLDARDPATVPQQIDFALDTAAKKGWGDWHGAANSGIGNFEGIGNAPAQVQTGAAAYAASPPSGMISAGQPQTGQAYSDDTWNHRPQYDYSGGGQLGGFDPSSVPPIAGQQGMLQAPGAMGGLPAGQEPAMMMNPLAVALLNDPNAASAFFNMFGFGGGGDGAAIG